VKARNQRWIVALAVGIALVAAAGVHDSAAKKRKTRSSVAATIDGKHSRWGGKNVTIQATSTDVTIVATITRPHRLNQLIRGVAVSCQLDLTGTFPVTPVFPQSCVLGYSEVRFGPHLDPKRWGGSNFLDGVVVTFDSLDGGRLRGSFQGTIPSEDTPPNPPVTLQGTFSVGVPG
jgi:hypothetical protein